MSPSSEPGSFMQTSDDAYEKFILRHLQHYGLLTGRVTSPPRTNNPSYDRWAVSQDYQSCTHSPDSPDSNSGDELDTEKTFHLRLPKPLRTRQLLIDFDGGRPIPRLREPRDLFSIPSLSSSFQGVRWPVECEVTVGNIYHTEWDPPQAEPFYQCTGHERTPMTVGEEKGNLVYLIDPATKTAHFTCSRVGGSRGPIKDVHCPSRQEPPLAFESRFESANLQKAVQVGVHDYELTLRHDLYTTKHTQWFYFRVQNMKAGIAYRFTVVNLLKSSSLYCSGMRPLLYSEQCAREYGQGWTRTGANIKYYRNNKEQDGRPLYSLTWTFEFPHEGDTCYLAHCYPYTYSDLQRYLCSVMRQPSKAAYCKLRVLCRSLAGNPVYVLTITAPGSSSDERNVKQAVVVTARVHPGETNSSWIMQGFLDFLLSDSPDACLLREMFVFKVVPMLNPDGVVVGNYRCSLAGRDLNRNYRTLLQESFPCVWHTRNMVKRLRSEREVVLYCDLHGHSRKNNVFMYGCDSRSSTSANLQERVFPLMMSKNAHDKFSFRSCKFKVQKSKEGTGRIVMWKLGIRNSYTMESTFGGSTLGSRTGTHFTTQDLKSIGYYLCDTLLDYSDPDTSKTNQCLAELSALLRLEIRRRLGQDLDSSLSLGGLSVSDIESSTSGSNSSESDGPPVHLVNTPDQPQKRHLRSRKERDRLHHSLGRETISKAVQKNTESQACSVPVKKAQDTLAMVKETEKRQQQSKACPPQCTICAHHGLRLRCTAQQSGSAWTPHHVNLTNHSSGQEGETTHNLCRGGANLCGGEAVPSVPRRPVSVGAGQSGVKDRQLLPMHLSAMTLCPRLKGQQEKPPQYTPPAHRVVPESMPTNWLATCRSVCFYLARSQRQIPPCNKHRTVAKVSIRYYLPESGPAINSINQKGKCGIDQENDTIGLSQSTTVKNGDKDLTHEAASSKPKICNTTFLPDLHCMDIHGKSHGQPSGDQAGLGMIKLDTGKLTDLRGSIGQNIPRVVPGPPESRFTLRPLADDHKTCVLTQVTLQDSSPDTSAECGRLDQLQSQRLARNREQPLAKGLFAADRQSC
ncbi:cytosolic carboxypeptidase 2 [Sardina pilchardus]|uniref:cytosolic carboxypeptidase 2 n=1 Tax=Sardina pilchardus TaxID=27697 RepID=UPI002E1354AB